MAMTNAERQAAFRARKKEGAAAQAACADTAPKVETLPAEAVFAKGRDVLTDSLMVAKVFGKEHSDVMESIQRLVTVAGNFRGPLLCFQRTEYFDSQGKKQPKYEMDRDGLSLLAFGFTGEEPLRWKLLYIEAFNKMEADLRGGASLATLNDISPAARVTIGGITKAVIGKAITEEVAQFRGSPAAAPDVFAIVERTKAAVTLYVVDAMAAPAWFASVALHPAAYVAYGLRADSDAPSDFSIRQLCVVQSGQHALDYCTSIGRSIALSILSAARLGLGEVLQIGQHRVHLFLVWIAAAVRDEAKPDQGVFCAIGPQTMVQHAVDDSLTQGAATGKVRIADAIPVKRLQFAITLLPRVILGLRLGDCLG